MKLGENRFDNKHHGVAETLFLEELSEGREGVSKVRDGHRRRAAEDVIEVLRVEDGAAGVEREFAAMFPVCERSPKPELEFHYGSAMGALAAGHGCVEEVPADGVKEGEIPAFLFADVGLGFELRDLAAEEVVTLTSVTSVGDDEGALSRWEGERGG